MNLDLMRELRVIDDCLARCLTEISKYPEEKLDFRRLSLRMPYSKRQVRTRLLRLIKCKLIEYDEDKSLRFTLIGGYFYWNLVKLSEEVEKLVETAQEND